MSGTHVHVSRTGAVEIRGARGFASSKLRVNSLRVPSAGIWAGLREAAVESSSPTTSPTARLPRASTAPSPSSTALSASASASASPSASPSKSEREAHLRALANLAASQRALTKERARRAEAEARQGEAELALRAELSSAHAEADALRAVIARLRSSSYETKATYMTKETAAKLREQSVDTTRAEFEAEIESTVAAMRSEWAATLRSVTAERNLHLARTVADVKEREADRLVAEKARWERATASRLERAEALRDDAMQEAEAARTTIETQRLLSEQESAAALAELEALWRRKSEVLLARLARRDAEDEHDALDAAALEHAEDERMMLTDRLDRERSAAVEDAAELRGRAAVELAAAEARHTHAMRGAAGAHRAELRAQWHASSEAKLAAAQRAVERYRVEVSFLLFTVTLYANHAYNLTCSP